VLYNTAPIPGRLFFADTCEVLVLILSYHNLFASLFASMEYSRGAERAGCVWLRGDGFAEP